MTDDTKALANRLRAINYIAAERDALAAECAKLREALRKQVVRIAPKPHLRRCILCMRAWDGTAESHAPGCLAAPKPSGEGK